jgi:dTDP-glucose 4,6-dehydratase
MPEQKTFLVLGSNSFSGASFVAHLAEEGYDVLATSRSPELHEAFLPYKWSEEARRVRFEQVDLNSDLDKLAGLIESERPSHIVNFAAQSMVGESWIHPDHWMTTNVVSLVRLQELLRKFDFLEKYVHFTTPEVYGASKDWIGEGAPFNPTTPYAVSRAAGDMSLSTYFTRYGFPVVFTRAANVFGPGQQLYRIVPRTILFAMLGRTLELHGGGHSIRSFIHIRDVSRATLAVALSGRPGETYHISTRQLVSIRDIVRMILERLDKDFDSAVKIVGERPGTDAAYMLDSSKIRAELGWSDKISLEDGLSETIEWAARYRDALAAQPLAYIHKP